MNAVKSSSARCYVATIALLLFCLAVGSASAGAPGKLLASADLHYRQKSFAAALKEYRAVIKAGELPSDRADDVEYRIAVSLGKTHQWDTALAQSLAFAKSHRNTVWEARGYYWLGRLYLAVPSGGYRVGSVVYRGGNVPRVSAAASNKPRRVDLSAQDRRDGREALEAARVVYSRLHARGTTQEEVQLDFDLAHVLYSDARFSAWQIDKKWLTATDPVLDILPDAPYSPDWQPPRKILTLYAHIRGLAGPRAHSSALSLLDEAMWLRHYQIVMRTQYAIRYVEDKPVPIPFPYEKRDALGLMRQAVREFPNDPIHDQTQFLLGNLLEQEARFTAAASEYRVLIASRPKSKWASDCRQALATMGRRSLSFSAQPLFAPGKPASIQLSTRNIGSVRFAAYRLPLERWLGQSPRIADPEFNMLDTSALLGKMKQAKRRLGRPVAEWSRPIPDSGGFKFRSTRLDLPIRDPGAYLVVAGAPGITAYNIVTLSDLVLVQKVERDRALFFAANARSGKPMPGAEILVRVAFGETNKKGEYVSRVAVRGGISGPDGLVSVPIPRKPKRNSFQVTAFGRHASSYAVTQQGQCGETDDNQGRFKTYGTTDRAVYRPRQVVQFREVVMERHSQGMKPAAGKPIHVEVFDPSSKRIYAALLNAGEFGSVNGRFTLPEGAPLGEYSVRCSVFKAETTATDSGGSQFRVEEYKKPEFQVTVSPDAERVRLGQPTSAKVSAAYYSGGPAANARVSYRVYRNFYAQTYKFPQPFDFLYDNAGQGSYDTGFRNGEVVAQGTARTDEKGEAKITFETKADSQRWRDQDLSYTVEADVKDSSRRTISGTGTVKATRHDVAIFLNYAHGYAHTGDHVPVEIVTLNPSDVPVSVEGVAKIFRQPADPKAKESLVFEKPLLTDTHGRAIYDWIAPRAGYYRVAFTARDSAGLEVQGATFVWIAGPELSRGEFLFQGIFLAVENPYYQEGQTARLLIATELPDCTVLLTREVNNQILDKRLVHITGRSVEIPIPLQHRDVPNVFISATMVRNGQLYQATQELFVPPVSQLAKVRVQADREKYQPGEKAKLQLAVTDWQGRPLRTELAVSITDAALGYIQKDYTADIRVYYYGDRRSQSIGNSGSTGSEFQAAAEDTQPARTFNLHPWPIPEGMGLLKIEQSRSRYLSGERSDRFVYFQGSIAGQIDDENGANTDPWIGVQKPRSRRVTSFILKNRSVETVLRARTVHYEGGIGSVSLPSGSIYGRRTSLAESNLRMPAVAVPPGPAGPAGVPGQEPIVRRQFLDTAFWTPAVVTDGQGNASVEVTWPDNLTRWRAYAVGNSAQAQVGTAETSVTTRKDLLVRLEAPRYFVERDKLVVSALIQNTTSTPTHVRVHLDLDGDTLETTGEPIARDPTASANGRVPSSQEASSRRQPAANDEPPATNHQDLWIDIPKEGERRVDWTVLVRHAGTVRLRAVAQAESGGDAMEATFPVLIHGVERSLTSIGVLRGGDGRAVVPVVLPGARKPGTSELVVQVNPSLAAVMLDALPYLNDYPYGCIEQTMSRFLPSVLTARTLKEQGFRLEDLRARMEALEKQAQTGRGALHVDDSPYTYPAGKPGTEPTVYTRWHDPVFDSRRLNKMVTAGLARIRDYQHQDGGWGWWKDDPSDTWMTAYVVYGLLQARTADYAFEPDLLHRAEQFLLKRFHEDDDLHRMAFVARVLAIEPEYRTQIRSTVSGRLYTGREKLSAYSKALLSLALGLIGEKQKAVVLLENLENTVQVDEREGTAHWGDSGSCWWRWYNNPVETNAAILQAYLAVQPGSRFPAMLVKWLVSHRNGDNWASTRETALAVYALSDYIRVNQELAPNYSLTVDLAGRVKRNYRVTRENALLFDNRFVVPDSLLETGSQTLSITKRGTGACYYNVYTRYFSQQESIPASGNGIYVTRRYFRLLPGTASGAPVQAPVDIYRQNPFLAGQYELLAETGTDVETDDTDAGPRYERAAMKEGETVTSGDLLEVELLLDARNDYDYLAFEDIKPAGCEPVEVRSGAKIGQGVCSNFELRDQKVVFFLSNITQGQRSLSYRLRAEAPGTFHALPTNGYAMYAPALRALSDESTLTVKDE